MKNIGGSYGGALTAGLFLQEFVDGAPWVHLDIAGPARANADDGYLTKGGTGFGVRTLVELARTFEPPTAAPAIRREGARRRSRRRTVDARDECGATRPRGRRGVALLLATAGILVAAAPATPTSAADDGRDRPHPRQHVLAREPRRRGRHDGPLGQRRSQRPQRHARRRGRATSAAGT